MATHSSTHAWRLPWTEEPGRLQFKGSLRAGHNLATSLSLLTFMHWRTWQPTPVFLPGESQGRGSLVGCRLWGCRESDTTEVAQQQPQQGIGLVLEDLSKAFNSSFTIHNQFNVTHNAMFAFLKPNSSWACDFFSPDIYLLPSSYFYKMDFSSIRQLIKVASTILNAVIPAASRCA